MSELLSGNSGGQGASQISGEWLTCPGSYWEWWYILRLHNISDVPIVVEIIEHTIIAGPSPAAAYVYTGESFFWNSTSPSIISPNTPEEGCAHSYAGSATLLDSWVIGTDTIAQLFTGLLVYQNSLPDDLIAASTPPYTLLHTFNSTPETWNPVGGLEILPGESIAIASGSRISIEITASLETTPITFDINGTINILGSMEVTYVPEEITFDVSGAIEIFGSMVATVDNHVTPCFSFPTNSFLITNDETSNAITFTSNDCDNGTEYEDEEMSVVTFTPCPPPRCN